VLTTRLAIAHLFSALAAGVCLAIGLRVLARRGEGVRGRAVTRYAIWWLALGANTLADTATWILGENGLAPPPVAALMTYLQLVCVTVMLWGLLSYLLYLFTGRAGALNVATLVYAAAFVGGLALIVSLRPTGVDIGPWGGSIAYATQPSPAAALLFALAFLLPPLVGAIAYALLLFRVRERDARYRIALVSSSIFVWFALSLALNGGGTSDARAVVGMVVPIAAIYATWIAYSPPAWIQRRLGVTAGGLGASHPRPPLAPGEREEFLARVRDLV
jgi:hypothetical protein